MSEGTDALVAMCANIAGESAKIACFAMAYQLDDGTVHVKYYGDNIRNLGLLALVKHDILNEQTLDLLDDDEEEE